MYGEGCKSCRTALGTFIKNRENCFKRDVYNLFGAVENAIFKETERIILHGCLTGVNQKLKEQLYIRNELV